MNPLIQALKDRRIVLAAGGALVALVAGLALALGLSRNHGDGDATPPAAQGGLIVEASAPPDGKMDPKARLRCFVAGQFVGEATLAECAQKNGVATGALDVGVDENGALAAANEGGTNIVPLPPSNAVVAAAPLPVTTPSQAPPTSTAQAPIPMGGCWKYAGGDWRKLPQDLSLNACVQAIFSGKCEHPGGASYGRWMSQTLRLVPGKVEVSGDNRSFRTLVEQGAGCAIPTVE